MTRWTKVPLDGLGMDRKAMLELVNRLNDNDDRKWVLVSGDYSNQMANPFPVQPYNQASAFPAALQ